MIENGDAYIPSELVFYESGVRVAQQEHKENKNKNTHRLVRDHLPYIAAFVQKELCLLGPPQKLTK